MKICEILREQIGPFPEIIKWLSDALFSEIFIKCYSRACVFSQSKDELDVKLCGVLVEGDQEALEYAYNSVKRGVPLVVMNNSGKIANAISFVIRSSEREEKSGAGPKDLEHKFIILNFLINIHYFFKSMERHVTTNKSH